MQTRDDILREITPLVHANFPVSQAHSLIHIWLWDKEGELCFLKLLISFLFYSH